MTIWDYLFVSAIIALDLIFLGVFVIAFLAHQQEKAARRPRRFDKV